MSEAEMLIGGMLFLHETKSRPLRFGGKVLSVEAVKREEFAHADRVVFKILVLAEGRGSKRRGASDALASLGNIVEVED